ncbi:AB hydrolase superfamily protein YdjP [Pseudovibrio axinellae]|uniref:AB hydrolase superfamily protein YdjP n=1 Tax=Pseudovibrio axinellae TaxID=989403 RepID=A0A165T4S0_9HYPH|nr:alpha/beta hydrolase [Pseudovibrio axinellae]KZL05426.1 AB hydrolase superfamily protein YdjP [Pseudovibrio axinellae]SEP99737.1 Pimeloyl-ACP methyl ester carboxylesterase [Pseudovibrio axinellae]
MERKCVQTRDGVTLSYLTGGRGPAVLLMGGWSQAATLFDRQFRDFAQTHTVYALDNRGHGDSQKPSDGYRIQRMAKDLLDVVEALGLTEFDIVAHSLSVAIVWAYLDMFGTTNPPRRLIFIDQPAALLARPSWTQKQISQAGAVISSLETLDDLLTRIRATDTIEDHLSIIRSMFTAKVGNADLQKLATENLKLPREYAAALIENNIVQDWRSFLPNISQTTLVFAGAGSIHPLASQEFIANCIPQAALEVVSEEDGGSHFLMFENPALFNEKALRFLNH